DRRRRGVWCSSWPRLLAFYDIALDRLQRFELLLQLDRAALLAQALVDLGVKQSGKLLHRARRRFGGSRARERLEQARGPGVGVERSSRQRKQQREPDPPVGAAILGKHLGRSVQFALLLIRLQRRDSLGVCDQLDDLPRFPVLARPRGARTSGTRTWSG